MRRLPQEFESLSEVVERLEFAGFSTERAYRAVRDILRDRRYLKRLSWADTDTGAITDQFVRVVGVASVDEVNWETSSFKNQLPDGRGKRLDKIGVLLADLRWYLEGGAKLFADREGPVRTSPSIVEPKDVHERSARRLAGERAAIKALASHLKSHPDITRAGATKWLVQQAFAVNPRGFQFRVWPEARRLAGLPPIAPPGAKKKSSRTT
jgi:hypothetical protein